MMEIKGLRIEENVYKNVNKRGSATRQIRRRSLPLRRSAKYKWMHSAESREGRGAEEEEEEEEKKKKKE